MACFRGDQEEFYGEVLLLDEKKITLTAERGIKRSSKAAAILDRVFSYLNVVEVEFFGLRFCDNKHQTHWLDPSKTLSQHRDLVGPPYIFYFGVRFYAEDPSKLKEETTRHQFYLQICQDVRQGRLPCPPHLKPRLTALMLQMEQDDNSGAEASDSDRNQEVQRIHKSLSGVSRPQAQNLFLSLCSSLQMYGVSLFNAYGENQSEYFLGPTPVGVVIFKNKVLVGKYFWQRITKLHFKDETFELRVFGKKGSETSFFFHLSDRNECKRLWRCCVEHHVFFRMSESRPLTLKLKHSSSSRSSTRSTFPWLSVGVLRNKTVKNNNRTTTLPTTTSTSPTSLPTTTTDLSMRPNHHRLHPSSSLSANQTSDSVSSEPTTTQTAPPAVQSRSECGAEEDNMKSTAPWENPNHVSGLFNPKFPLSTKEEEQDGGRPQRRSRSLDGDRPIRPQRRRCRSHGNKSSGSESEKSNNERRRRTKNRRSPDVLVWQHIQKQLVEPDVLLDRQSEEIPYMDVRVSGEPIRTRRSRRGRRHHQCTSASDLQSKMELVPPLPVTKAMDTSCRLPTSP